MKANPRLFAIALVGLTAVLPFTFPFGELRAADLKISTSGNQAVLFWPTGAVGYALEATDQLGPGVWSAVTNPPAVVGANRFVTNPIIAAPRFYRLRAAAPTAPALSGLIASTTTLSWIGGSSVSFAYFDPDGDIAALEMTSSNEFGIATFHLSAAELNIAGPNGQTTMPFGSGDLPFGQTSFSLRLRDSGGRQSAPVTFTLELIGVGAGVSAPLVQDFTGLSSTWNRPIGPHDLVRPLFRYDFQDADADIERVRIRVTGPDNTSGFLETGAASQSVVGVQGSVTNSLLALGATNALGAYSIELTLIDRNGNLSQPATASLFLMDAGGAEPLAITSFTPQQGAPGTAVTISGSGFDPVSATNLAVLLAGVPVETTNVSSSDITVLIPEGAATGKFSVRNQTGTAYSSNLFTVPMSVKVLPQTAEVAVGMTEQFQAALASTPTLAVNWSVNGIVGGNTTVGTISSNGLYQTPAEIPAGGAVTIGATLVSIPALSGSSQVKILPPPLTPGSARVLASAGGTVRSADGRAWVTIPPNALNSNTNVSVQILRGTNLPTPPPALRLLGAVEFGPGGAVFKQPVTITLPLVTYYEPGTPLSLRLFNPANGSFTDEGVMGTVGPHGDQVSAQVTHFSTLAAVAALPFILPSPPGITGIFPTSAQEGTKVPLQITGTDLTSDLEIEILLGGAPTTDILPGTFYPMTNTAGLLLDIQTIPNLNEGSSRSYTIRLKRFGGLVFTNTTFTVQGLNELIVGSGQTNVVSSNANRRYSRIEIGANSAVTFPTGAIEVESTGPVVIHGRITGQGNDGQSGVARAGGAGGGGLHSGGSGGIGRDDSGCNSAIGLVELVAGLGENECAPPGAYGSDGDVHVGLQRIALGRGGEPGLNADLDLVQTVLNFISCFGGDILSCVSAVGNIIEIIDTTGELIDGTPMGRNGSNGYPEFDGFGHGGGGGGGGGRLKLGWSTFRGGGGGGGGSGGRPVSVITSDELTLDGDGLITSEGGRGGDGAVSGDIVPLPPPLPTINLSFTGGGGGGGTGGRLTVSAGNGLYRLDHARISAAGGLAGSRGLVLGSQVGGSPIRVALTGRWPNRAIRGEFTLTDSHSPRVGSAPVFLADPANNVVAADTKVTTRRLLRVRFLAEDRHEPLQIIQAGTTNQFMGTTESDGISRSALVLLGPGLNQLTMRNMHVLLQRQILVLGPDSDGDGLSFADETDLGTDPNVADSDHDGLNDGAEILAGSNPLNPDTDGDGLSDGQEMAAGTSSLVPDSDGDGIGDGVEFVLGSNPASALSTPSTTPQNILFADSSGANGDFLTIIDPNTGAFGLLGQPNGGQPFGLAFDTIPVLFVARGSNLASHQPLPNITTPVGVIGAPGGNPINVQSLTYQPTNDTLYGIEEGPLGRTGQLVAIDPSSGTGTRIGAAGPNPVNCLLVLADGRLLAAVKATASSDRLVRLNPQTGAVAQDIGLIGFTPIVGLGLGTNGVIHAAQRISSTESRLLTVNLATGQGTPTVNVHRGISGLAMFSFRKVPALVSINRFDAASGSGSSDGAVFLSTDGRYVAFTSQASDLVPLADTNAAPDAFLRDLQTGTTELVSVNRFGTAAASSPSFSGSYSSAISADGRYVAFLSWAFDLVGNDFNGLPDLFRRDRLTGTTRLVSVNLSGDPAAAASSGLGVAMSADGRYLAFVTDASGVAVGDTNPGNDVFLRDMVANTTQLVSRSGGLALPGDSRNPIISANGNVVAFWYRTTNQNSRQVLALDVPNNTLTVLTRDRSGAVRFGSAPTDISADGRYIVYASAESELVSQTDTNNTSDVFRYDLLNQTNVLVSVNLAGTATGNGESYQPSISADGRYVTFTSKATNLASVTDTNGAYDIFVRDMVAGTTALVSINSSGTATAYYSRLGLLGDSFNPVISGDGLRVMFLSYATNVVALPPGMNQRSQDVYVRDLPSGKTTVLSANYLGTALGASVSGQGGTHSISSNGLVAAFTSLATNLARITDTNQQPDVFFRLITP